MELKVRAYQKYVRQAPRKLRLVADVIRGLDLQAAKDNLTFTRKRAAQDIRKVLVQAEANAKQVALMSKSLKIDSIEIEEGPTYKRWMAVSRGRAHSIFKRSSHIKVILTGEKEQSKNPEVKKTNKVKAKEAKK